VGQFPESVVKEAWKRAGGSYPPAPAYCECKRSEHGHSGRCNKQLVWENRGKEGERGAWEAHHTVSQEKGGEPILSNCEILCLDCHKKTKTYGG